MRQHSYPLRHRGYLESRHSNGLGMHLACLTLLGLVAAVCALYFPDFRRYMHIKRM